MSNSFFDENNLSKQNTPRWDAAFCGAPSGLFCLPMSHKKDVRLIADRLSFSFQYLSKLRTYFLMRVLIVCVVHRNDSVPQRCKD